MEDDERTLHEAMNENNLVLIVSHKERTTLLLNYATGTPIYTIENNSNGTKSDFFVPGERDGVIGTLNKGLFGRKLIRNGKSIRLRNWIKSSNSFSDSEERVL
jgi:hypothetical protein